jgi:hypothetical protein
MKGDEDGLASMAAEGHLQIHLDLNVRYQAIRERILSRGRDLVLQEYVDGGRMLLWQVSYLSIDQFKMR